VNTGHIDMIKTTEFDEEYLEEKFKEFNQKIHDAIKYHTNADN